MWNWQKPDWPQFTYDEEALAPLEETLLIQMGTVFGAIKHVSEREQEELKIELLSEEALKTSKIEGEMLDRQSLQSSLRNQFGLKTNEHRVPAAEQGISEVMVNLWKTFDQPLTHEMLWLWHQKLMAKRRDLDQIGNYRTHQEPMQVVSGSLHKPKIHFEGPPSKCMLSEMNQFIIWFNNSGQSGPKKHLALVRAGMAHLYFISIHPFEDGNGRIGRALSEKALASSLGYPTLISLAYTIERHRSDYYNAIERSNKTTNITWWLEYYAKTVLEAQQMTLKRIEFIIAKTKLYDRLKDKLNPRQTKVLERMFREGMDGFKGGMSAKKYITITGAPRATATRDLTSLVEKGGLLKTGQLRYTRYFLNLPGFFGQEIQKPNIQLGGPFFL